MSRIVFSKCTIFTVILSTIVICGEGEDGLSKCGQLSIEQPTILGRNITFSFTPDVHDPNSSLEWQKSNTGKSWDILRTNYYKFYQYKRNMTFFLVVADSVKYHDDVFYRVHYYNETMHCLMKTRKLHLEDLSYTCGLVYLRTKNLVKNGAVEIEYYPPIYLMSEMVNFTRIWVYYSDQTATTLDLNEDRYKETLEQNDKYVLTIFKFNVSMNGRYGVTCISFSQFTNFVPVELPETPKKRNKGEEGKTLSTTATSEERKNGETGITEIKTDKNNDCTGIGAMVGSVIASLAVGILFGVIFTWFLMKRKTIKVERTDFAIGPQPPTVSEDTEFIGLNTYEHLQSRAGTEGKETYDSLDANSSTAPSSQTPYESLGQRADKTHTYSDLKI